MATREKLQRFLDGVVARGWAYSGLGPIDFSAEPARGFVRRVENGSVVFEAIDEDPFANQEMVWDRAVPEAYALSTPVGGALLLSLWSRMGGSFSIGGSAESVFRIQADTVAFGIDLADVRSAKFDEMSMTFPGLGAWAGIDIVSRSLKYDGQKLVGQSIDITEPAAVVAARQTRSSMTLQGSGHWRVSEPNDGTIGIDTGLSLSLGVKRARPPEEFSGVFADLQQLLAIANRGLICAEAAPSLLSAGGGSPLVYVRQLMHLPPRAIAATSKEAGRARRVAYTGALLGGIDTLARWTHVAEQHPAVVSAVCATYREGPESIDSAIRTQGAAIEQYVARYSRKTKWATVKGKPKGYTFTHALAHHAGSAFAGWVGDPGLWADAFHNSYLASKHLIPRAADAQRDALLARTGRWLLTATLADQAAGSRKPSEHSFRSSELRGLGKSIRTLLGT